MVNYAVMEDYDSTYKIKNREISCYSKSKMKKIFPNGNFCVIGETLSRNKKKEIDRIELADKEFIISEENSHSSVFTRTVGYINNGKGEYIALLKRNFIILWILFGILAILAIILCGLFLLSEKPVQPTVNEILPPDYELVVDDPNAVTEVNEEEPEDHVIIHIPKGNVELDIKSDTGLKPNETGRVKIIFTIDGVDYEILEDSITVLGDGKYPDLQIDFTKLSIELKPGRYLGWIIFTAPDGRETKLPILIVIRNTYGGSMTVGYSDKILVDLVTGDITMMYSHGLDASHDCILQLILDNGGNEYLLCQSGALHPGQSLSAMKLIDGIASQLTAGVYHGRLRVNLYNGESKLTDMNTDIEVSITVQSEDQSSEQTES